MVQSACAEAMHAVGRRRLDDQVFDRRAVPDDDDWLLKFTAPGSGSGYSFIVEVDGFTCGYSDWFDRRRQVAGCRRERCGLGEGRARSHGSARCLARNHAAADTDSYQCGAEYEPADKKVSSFVSKIAVETNAT